MLHSLTVYTRALSRSDKKIIHVDRNPYYGGAEAAFSLQEAQEWVDNVNKGVFCLSLVQYFHRKYFADLFG